MKALKDLSKDELLSFISYLKPDIDKDEQLDCAACGSGLECDADYYYICDTCDQAMIEDRYIKNDVSK